MRTIASSSPNRNSASVRASSVLPTPDGPRKMNEPVGRFGSLRPARERRIAFETTSIAGCWPMTRLCSSSSMRISFCVSASVSLKTGMPVHIETMSAISSSPIAGRSPPSPRLPLLLELALLVGELALLVAQVGGLLELLRLDRGLLVAPRRPRSPPRARGTRAAEVIDLMRMREAASSMRSIALSGRKRSEM